MTISNNRFDRLFSRINMLEEKLEGFDPITNPKRFQKIQNRIDRLQSKLPQDEFEITHRGDGTFDIQVTDSPYDNTYVGGSKLKFSVSGVKQTNKGTKRRTSSIVLESFENETGSTFAGSSSFESISENYDEVFATLYGQGNQVLETVSL